MTPRQRRALDALLVGVSISEAADAAGVARQTCTGWLNHDDVFRETYERELDQLTNAAMKRALALVTKALDVVERALGDGDIRSAIALLRGTNIISSGTNVSRCAITGLSKDDSPARVIVHMPDNGRRKETCPEGPGRFRMRDLSARQSQEQAVNAPSRP